ncbi:hypothetical protein VCHENC02_3959, partial [Vibrio harveyi]
MTASSTKTGMVISNVRAINN